MELKKEEEYWYLLQTRVFEEKLGKCFALFRANGIEPILIKGWAAARYYDAGRPRIYTDIDLCVEPSDYETALRLAQSAEGAQLGIDIHSGLKTLDTVCWKDLFEKSLVIRKEDHEIRVLRPEDHLRVLAVHWLTDGGEQREKLWDIFYLVKNRPIEFDWDRCLGPVSATRRKWIVCTIGLAHKYLALDLAGLPFAEEASHLPVWLTRTVEREWSRSVRLIPLRICWHDPKLLMQQILKRIPPNPIQSTVNLEGEFDGRSRVNYQVRDFFKRLGGRFVR